MNKSLGLLAALCLLVGCESQQGEGSKRAELRRVGSNTFELIPTEGQPEFCLVYTIAEGGTLRQLTMTHENKSLRCPAGQPVAGVSFRVPEGEGKTRVLVFFSDQKLNAASIGEQIFIHQQENPSWQPYDLRLPGKMVSQQLWFTPETAAPTEEGSVIGASGAPSDAVDTDPEMEGEP